MVSMILACVADFDPAAGAFVGRKTLADSPVFFTWKDGTPNGREWLASPNETEQDQALTRVIEYESGILGSCSKTRSDASQRTRYSPVDASRTISSG